MGLRRDGLARVALNGNPAARRRPRFQLGLWLGGRLGEELREGTERLASQLLILTAVVFVAFKVTGDQP